MELQGDNGETSGGVGYLEHLPCGAVARTELSHCPCSLAGSVSGTRDRAVNRTDKCPRCCRAGEIKKLGDFTRENEYDP